MTKRIKLKDIATVITKGTTPTSLGYDFVDTGINFIKIESITEEGAFLKDKFAHINEDCNRKLNRSQLKENDILFSIAGVIGRVAIATKDILPANTNQALAIIRIPDGLYDYDFLKYVLRSSTIVKQFEKRKQGVAQLNISLKNIGDFEIPFPSLEEQQHIATILDRVSKLINIQKKQLSKLDELVKARFIELFGDVSNSPKYSGVPLGTICSTLSGGTPTTKIPAYYQGDIPWISTPYLGNNHINGSSAKAYITEDAIKNSATHLIPANTIMFGIRVGVGKSSIIDEPMCANQDIVALMGIDNNKYNLLFVKHVLDSYQSHFDSIKKGATILGITTDDLKKVMIPVVDMELQNQFATFVELTDKSKLTIQQSLEKLETLKKSLMQKYFG